MILRGPALRRPFLSGDGAPYLLATTSCRIIAASSPDRKDIHASDIMRAGTASDECSGLLADPKRENGDFGRQIFCFVVFNCKGQ
jgi:hypothetical protein